MSLKHVAFVSTVGALLAAPGAFAFGGESEPVPGEQCNMSSLFGEYRAPKNFASAQTEIKTRKTADRLAAEQAKTFQWLSAAQPSLAEARPISVELTRQDLLDIGAEVCDNCYQLRPDPRRYQVGVAKDFSVKVDFGRFDARQLPKTGTTPFNHGVVSSGPDGELVWTAVFHQENATALRIGLSNFALPADAEMYVYTDHGEAFGPYVGHGPTDKGHFWTNTTAGDTAYLQLHYYGATSPAAMEDLDFRISGIGHMGPRFKLAGYVKPEAFGDKAFCSWNADCVVNDNCTSDSAVSDARLAVAEMIFRSGGGYYICTGGLLADTDTSSVIPYFLTANHCISKGGEASSLETIFDFEVPCGTSDCPRYGEGFSERTLGSTIVATNRTSDYTLLQLDQIPGGTRAYLGWTNAEIAFTHGASLYRVSHPAGSPQAFSSHDVDTSKGTCRTWPRGSWIYSADVTGATEGGSSGSPVVNGSGQVVGQLSGACGTNVSDNCDSVNNATVDGALAAYWGEVQPFLDPDGSGGGDDGGGDDGGGEQCDLLPSGSSCTADSECCSNKCKGKPGSRTCN